MSGVNQWNEKLCDCCSDCAICCYGFWCTPCLYGSNAEKVDDSNCFLMCCLYTILAYGYACWIPHCLTRKKLRDKYNLVEDPCNDCLTAAFCGPCALCQEAREMKSRENHPNMAFNKVDANVAVVSQPGNYPNYPDGNAGMMSQPAIYPNYYDGNAGMMPQSGSFPTYPDLSNMRV